jgi:DNA polymerase-3 subunit alpha
MAASVLAGYTLGGADELRRAMGKKKREVMEEQRDIFVKGCARINKINQKLAGQIFDKMAKFAEYGFNKAHSTGYAVIAWQTAYLKANYTPQFMAALLSSEIGNFDKIPVFIQEAQEMGLQILPPDVNESGVRFRPAPGAVRFGLAGIKNVGEGAAEAVVREREARGKFRGLVDFCSRLDSQSVNKKAIESLVRCGAMDSFGMHRARLLHGIDFAMSRASNAQRDRLAGQRSLFDLLGEQAPEAVGEESLPDHDPLHQNEMLAAEKELLGMYMSGHPLTQYEHLLRRYGLSSLKGIQSLEDRAPTRVGGILTSVEKRLTKKKETMAIAQLEDLEGSVRVLMFHEAFERQGANLIQDAAVFVAGEVNGRDSPASIQATEVFPMSEAPRLYAKRLSVHIPAAGVDDGKLQTIKDLLAQYPGAVPVGICLLFPSGEKVFLEADASVRVTPEEELIQRLQHELGEEGVYISVNRSPYRNPPPDRRRPGPPNGGDRY